MTQSPDTVNVWSIGGSKGLKKLRTFNANGVHYLSGRMSQCGESLLTLQKDGTTVLLSIDNTST